MPSYGVIEAVDVTSNGGFGLVAGAPDGAPDQLGLDGFEHGFDHRVVIAIALAAHRRSEAVILQELQISVRAVLGGFNRLTQHQLERCCDEP